MFEEYQFLSYNLNKTAILATAFSAVFIITLGHLLSLTHYYFSCFINTISTTVASYSLTMLIHILRHHNLHTAIKTKVQSHCIVNDTVFSKLLGVNWQVFILLPSDALQVVASFYQGLTDLDFLGLIPVLGS